MCSKPLDIVYNPSTIAQVKEFFAGPLASQSISGSGSSTQQWRQELETQTTAGLRHLEGEGRVCGWVGKGLLHSMARMVDAALVVGAG